MPEVPYNPEIPHDENHPCLTCTYQAKYANLLILQETLQHLDSEHPQAEQMQNTINSEIVNLLNLGNYIAEQRCMGNYMAAIALYN